MKNGKRKKNEWKEDEKGKAGKENQAFYLCQKIRKIAVWLFVIQQIYFIHENDYFIHKMNPGRTHNLVKAEDIRMRTVSHSYTYAQSQNIHLQTHIYRRKKTKTKFNHILILEKYLWQNFKFIPYFSFYSCFPL